MATETKKKKTYTIDGGRGRTDTTSSNTSSGSSNSGFQDLRNESYQKLAEERFANSPTSGQNVSINPNNIVTGTTGSTSGGSPQVAIRGGGGGSVLYSGGNNNNTNQQTINTRDSRTIINTNNQPTADLRNQSYQNMTQTNVNSRNLSQTLAGNPTKQRIIIALDKNRFQQNQESLEKAGLKTAKDFFEASKRGDVQVKGREISLFYTKKNPDKQEVVKRTYSGTINADTNRDSFTEKANQLAFKGFKSGKVEYQVGAFGVSLLGGFTKPLRNPVGFLKDTFNFYKGAITNPKQTATAVTQQALINPSVFLGDVAGQSLFFKGASKVSPVKVNIVKDTNLGGKIKGVQIDYPTIRTEKVLNLKFGFRSAEPIKGLRIIDENPSLLSKSTSGRIIVNQNSKLIPSPSYRRFLLTEEGRLYQDFLNIDLEFKNMPRNPKPTLAQNKPITSSKTGKEINFFKQPEEPDGFTITPKSDRTIADTMNEQGRIFNVKTGEFDAPANKKSSSRFLDDADDSTSLGIGGSSNSELGKNLFPDLSGRKQKLVVIEAPEFIKVKNPLVREESKNLNLNIVGFSNNNNKIGTLGSYNINSVNSKNIIYKTTLKDLNVRNLTENQTKPDNKVNTLLSNKSRTLSIINSKQNINLIQSQGISQRLSQNLGQTQVQKQNQMQKQTQVQKQNTLLKTLLENQKNKVFTPKIFLGKRLFNVEVKSKGKFRSVGQGLNLKDAIKLGKDLTGRTASRSFKIKNQTGKPLKGFKIGGNYYQKGDSFIEKTSSAINTGGEFLAITKQGILANTQKKRKKLYNKNNIF